MPTQGVIVREMKDSDVSYVRNSWCKSSYSHLTAAHFLSKQGQPPAYQVYKVLFDRVMDKVLTDADCSVAVNDDDYDQILGFVVYTRNPDGDHPVLHYVQTKKDLWGNGIARTMLEAVGITKEQPCIYTFTSPILGKWRTPGKWKHIPHWMK